MRAAPRDCSRTYGACWHDSMTFPGRNQWRGELGVRTGLNGKTWYRYQCNTPRRWYVNFYNGMSGMLSSPPARDYRSPSIGMILVRPRVTDLRPRNTGSYRTRRCR